MNVSQRLRVILAVSGNGYTSAGLQDRMDWTSHTDKALFRVMTLTGTRLLGLSKRTQQLMPIELPMRTLIPLSRRGVTVEQFAKHYPGSWLIGGQTLVMNAIRLNLVDEVHLSWSTKSVVEPKDDHARQVDELLQVMEIYGLYPFTRTQVDTVRMDHWLLK